MGAITFGAWAGLTYYLGNSTVVFWKALSNWLLILSFIEFRSIFACCFTSLLLAYCWEPPFLTDLLTTGFSSSDSLLLSEEEDSSDEEEEEGEGISRIVRLPKLLSCFFLFNFLLLLGLTGAFSYTTTGGVFSVTPNSPRYSSWLCCTFLSLMTWSGSRAAEALQLGGSKYSSSVQRYKFCGLTPSQKENSKLS